MVDLISRQNLEIHNDGKNKFSQPHGSAMTDLVLTRNISNN